MYAQRPDLRVLLYMLGEIRILEWIQSVGVCQDEILSTYVPPFPPKELREITTAPDLPEFLWTGLVDMDCIRMLYEKAAGHTDSKHSGILNFGCSCGRMVRFLNNYSESYTVHACEVNPDHVNWCQNNLSNVQTSQSYPLPPLPTRIECLIYGLSVFTHLSEGSATKWLPEMKRVLRPSRILFVSIHGITVLNTIKNSALHQKLFNLSTEVVTKTMENFQQEPFVFSYMIQTHSSWPRPAVNMETPLYILTTSIKTGLSKV